MSRAQDHSTPNRIHRLHGSSRNQVLARDLAQATATLDEGWTGGAALELCANHPNIPSFAVLDGRRHVVGLIERARLLYQFSQPLVADVYRRRPVAPLVSRDAMIVDADMPIEGIKELIAYRYPQAISSGFAVVEAGIYLGMGTMMGLLEKTVDLAHLRAVELEEAQRKAEEASAAKSRFLATMSHELRTPLNAILGFSELLLLPRADTLAHAQRQAYVADIRDSGAHLLSLITDILDYSRLEAAHLPLQEVQFELAPFLVDCLRLVRAQAEAGGLSLTLAPAPALAVLGDELRLRQCVVNLLANAIKFTPSGGRVALSATLSAPAELEITVRDTGCGIPADQLEQVFEPFHQVDSDLNRATNGTGLGLPLSRKLVQRHGGTLTLASKLGEGTEARIVLPRRASPLGSVSELAASLVG
jgi:two-component system cell cycle sensor histidine kinase PleC